MIIGFKGYKRADKAVFSKALKIIAYYGVDIEDDFNTITRDLLDYNDCDAGKCNVLFMNLDVKDVADAVPLVKHLKSENPWIIIIATTKTGVDKEIEIGLFNANINDVLTGALDPDLVLARLENQLKHIFVLEE